MTPVIQTQNLSRSYGRTAALQGLDLTVPQNAIYALVGPNGAGKTTIIKLLMNILCPTAGNAQVLGHPAANVGGEVFTHIGYVSENQELPEWMSVSYFLSYLRPFYPTWDAALEQHLLRQFDLPLDRKIKHLSRGMKMKVALASVLAYRPALIVLDEPFSGLDPLVRDELIEGLLERAPESTILLSSHDLAEIESFATHVAFLHNGSLLFSEEMPALSARFREVTVTLSPSTPQDATAP
ncbi:MAG TPA: ABC transporter ATP-binding protein, partial [Edaphobacter sp.]|nr:ABC transporter ATP-binding protein [Edaphobacter sp.]